MIVILLRVALNYRIKVNNHQIFKFKLWSFDMFSDFSIKYKQLTSPKMRNFHPEEKSKNKDYYSTVRTLFNNLRSQKFPETTDLTTEILKTQ